MTMIDTMHSGKSRGGVCGSEFHGKTVKDGGWNRVGLERKGPSLLFHLLRFIFWRGEG